MIDNTTLTREPAEPLDLTASYTGVAPVERFSQEEEQLAGILDQYVTALEQGAPLDIERLASDHPHLESQIRLYADSLNLLHDVTGNLRSKGGRETNSTPRRLGDFEIAREIGRGGMGVVYEARQISLDRPVALKVLPFTAVLDQKQVLRFRNEAQAAAQLHHPHIVPVYAVGQERGIHYYAMQYIEGQSLEEALRQLRDHAETEVTPAKPLASTIVDKFTQTTLPAGHLPAAFSTCPTTTSAGYYQTVARLGKEAAEAIHHAHEHGVLHRDIKPSNLMVDQAGKLWVTDFGLARITDNPGVTMTGDVVGTLRYMSPEQAAGNQALIDPRSDIYSLGATLYEMLAWQHAIPGDNRQQLLRKIAEEEPVPIRKLNWAVPIDLETIVLQAMAKAREQRYSTAQELAKDLDRYLAGLPTLARRPTIIDRGVRWVQRHRRVSMLAASFVVILATVSTVGTALLLRERSQKQAALQQAEQNLERAEGNLSQAWAVVDRFVGRYADQIAVLPGSTSIRKELLEDTLKYYQSFIVQAGKDPKLQTAIAETYFKSGDVASKLGFRDQAKESYAQSLTILDKMTAAEKSPPVELISLRIDCFNHLGLVQAAEGNLDEARVTYRRALDENLAQQAATTKNPELICSLAETCSNLGLLERQSGNNEQAKKSYSWAIKLLEAYVKSYPQESRPNHALAISYNNRSFLERQGNPAVAEKSCQRAIDLLEDLVEGDRATAAHRADLALCYNNLGAIESQRQDWAAATKSYDAAISIQKSLVRQAPSVVQYRADLGTSLTNRGQVESKEENWTAADASFNEAVGLLKELVTDYPEEIAFQSILAGILNNQATRLEQQADFPAAIEKYQAAIDHQLAAVVQSPRQAQYRENLSKHFFNLARTQRSAGLAADAAQTTLRRRELWTEHAEHLYEIAHELEASRKLLANAFESEENRKLVSDLQQETLRSLEMALEAGLVPSSDLTEFVSLEDLPNYDSLHERWLGKLSSANAR